jgi:hypothetical protein
MTPERNPRAASVDALYVLALDEFTAARDELARTLRVGGEREAGQDVKRLRKPSLTAWALNQVRRNDPQAVDELIAAGQRLRAATERLLAKREREPLQHAIADERRIVSELAGQGERRLADAGHSVSAVVHTKLVATLHAAATDPEARELLCAGRLVHDYEVSGLGLGLELGTMPDGTPPTPKGKAGAESRPAAAAAAAARERRIRDERTRLQTEQARQAELGREAAAAAREVEVAQRQAERAQSALQRAQVAAEQADAQARAATERVTRLQTSLRELESSSS